MNRNVGTYYNFLRWTLLVSRRAEAAEKLTWRLASFQRMHPIALQILCTTQRSPWMVYDETQEGSLRKLLQDCAENDVAHPSFVFPGVGAPRGREREIIIRRKILIVVAENRERIAAEERRGIGERPQRKHAHTEESG